MLHKRILFVLVALFMTGCTGGSGGSGELTEAEQAQATVQAMLETAKLGDWESYIERFYGEKSKIRGREDMNKLAARFRDTWGEQLIPALEEAATITPVIEDGKAVFRKDGRDVFVLYKSALDGWTFHL